MILLVLSLVALELIVLILVLEMYKIVLLVIEIHFVNYVSKTLIHVLLGLVEFDLIVLQLDVNQTIHHISDIIFLVIISLFQIFLLEAVLVDNVIGLSPILMVSEVLLEISKSAMSLVYYLLMIQKIQ